MTLALALCLLAQDPSTLWDGKEISQTTVKGARRESKVAIENQSGLKKGLTLTKERLDRAYKSLWAMNRFDQIKIVPTVVDGKVQVVIEVVEYDVVDKVIFDPKPLDLEERKLSQELRIVPGEPLNPFLLKVDRERLRNQYLDEGYPFSTVEDVLSPSAHGGVVLTWRILEGPRVNVKEIVFSGNASVSDGDLRAFMLSKQNPRLFFITTGSEPFVERPSASARALALSRATPWSFSR